MRTLYPTLTAVILSLGCSSSSSNTTTADGGTNHNDDGASGGDSGGHEADSGKLPIDGFAWADSFKAGLGSSVLAMASDADSVIIVGQITGSATFGSTKLTALDTTGNAFVVKLDKTGSVVWGKIATGDNSEFEGVTLDASGNVILAGIDFGDGADFVFGGSTLSRNQGAPINGHTPSSGGGVLVELSPAGDLMWSKYVDTTGEVNMSTVVAANGAIYVAGPIIDDADFGNGSGPVVGGCGTMGCVFLATYDSSGNIQTAVIAPSTPHRGTGVDPREVWLAASASKLTMAIGGYYSSAGGETDDTTQLVVNQYDFAGKLQWHTSVPDHGGASPTVTGLAVDAKGNAYVSGDIGTGLDLGLIKDVQSQYLAQVSPAGVVTWAVDNKGSEELGMHGLALGDQLYSFGNGDVSGTAPPGGTSMSLDVFDPTQGKLVANAPCSALHGIGEQITASSAGVFIAGEGGSTGTFGAYKLTAEGFFVAKLQ
jgi:hypothetical protein